MDENKEDFNEENIPTSEWMKFSQVGDYVKGTFVEKSLKAGVGEFKDQMVYSLINCEVVSEGNKKDSIEINVGISKDYINGKLKDVVPGQRVGLRLEKEIPAKIKGHHPAKSILVNVWGMDPEFKVAEEEETFTD